MRSLEEGDVLLQLTALRLMMVIMMVLVGLVGEARGIL
jgi:hypothetical protein